MRREGMAAPTWCFAYESRSDVTMISVPVAWYSPCFLGDFVTCASEVYPSIIMIAPLALAAAVAGAAAVTPRFLPSGPLNMGYTGGACNTSYSLIVNAVKTGVNVVRGPHPPSSSLHILRRETLGVFRGAGHLELHRSRN